MNHVLNRAIALEEKPKMKNYIMIIWYQPVNLKMNLTKCKNRGYSLIDEEIEAYL